MRLGSNAPRRLLDTAAGSGTVGVTFASLSPEVRRTSLSRLDIESTFIPATFLAPGHAPTQCEGQASGDRVNKTQEQRASRRWSLPVRIFLVTVVVAVSVFTLSATGFWLYVTRPQDVRVEAYAVVNPTTLLAEVTVGVDEEFVSAYAEETPTLVVLHVETRRVPGAYPAIGLMASEEIKLKTPIGDRKVRAFDGSRVREASLERVSNGSIDEVVARWWSE